MSPPPIKVRGAGRAKGIPAGYLLGRTSEGTGDVELLNLAELRKAGVASAGSVAATDAKTGFGFFIGGLPNNNELIGSATYPTNVQFVSGDGAVTSGFPAAASAVLNLQAPDPTTGLPVNVGTITFAASSKTGVIAWSAGAYTLLAGKALSLYAPTPVDASLADISGTVNGTKV
jgi:hypothetical protein